MADYPSNSRSSKEAVEMPKKRVEKVIDGTARKTKKSSILKLTDIFIPEDMNAVKDHILMDVIVPAAKKAISDIVDTILYGEAGTHNRTSSTSSRVSYGGYYEKKNSRTTPQEPTRNKYNYDSIMFDNRGEAEEVLSRMDELMETYGNVSVADYYDLAGVTCDYTDNDYGWTKDDDGRNDIRSAKVTRTRDGYSITGLPRVKPLK